MLIDETISLGNFRIILNENGSLTLYANEGAVLIKPSTGSSVTIYSSTVGSDPQVLSVTVPNERNKSIRFLEAGGK